jgi:hypothetical protein
MLALALMSMSTALTTAQSAATGSNVAPPRPKGPCDIYAAAADPCVAAHSTTRALFASYNGPLYQVLRQSDGKILDIGVVQPVASPVPDAGGYADASAQDAFCANTYCWISKIYDQSPRHNDLTQAPRGGFSGPALGGFNNLPLADMAPISIMGHKAYGVFIEPGMGLRDDDAKGTAVDDQSEGQYWVINGRHFNNGCCFDYGNAEIDSRDDDNGTMETAYFGDTTPWYHGNGSGPWIMTDQENNLVGCVNPDGSKGCANLPSIHWRFVTAMAKGEPRRWTSMGGDAQSGALSVMFSGPRVNTTYDPMRKQGAILLGNGGDNSNASQGTFYEGAMTAAGTFPSNATDQLVQANIVAAGYNETPLSLAPTTAVAAPPGLQTFTPGSSREATLRFTNTAGAPASGVKLSITVPGTQWTSFVAGTNETSKTFADSIAPGASVSATFKVTSGPEIFNGDLVGNASWTNGSSSSKQSETAVEKVRNVGPIKINEFRIGSSPSNSTDSFIELYNAGAKEVDISSWALTEHPTQQAIFSAIKIPAGTELAPGGFYLLGLSNSGLAVPARAGDTTLHIRSTVGMNAGDSIMIGTGSTAETRVIAKLGTAVSNHTTLWQPLPDGPVITIPVGSTNVPVTSISGFAVGQKIALGYGATYPAVARGLEQDEVATVTAVGKPGTQGYLEGDAPAGVSNIQVSSVGEISVGDRIRLDIDSLGHGIETVTVTRVGTAANRTNLAANANAGATNIKVRNVHGFAVGDKLTIGTPASRTTVTITGVGSAGPAGTGVDFTPALTHAHIDSEEAIVPGTGLDLAAPLKFKHAANLPFSDPGTGISFEPATAFAHSSNEPVQPLGTGITLDKPLTNDHAINAVIRDASVTTAGYQGSPAPNQWFGGPEFFTDAVLFGRFNITFREGSIVLRDASGLVVDSLNYGAQVDPWAAEGYEAASGPEQSGCHAPAPGAAAGSGPFGSMVAGATDTSTGRFPDGADTDSNCNDFLTQAATTLSAPSAAGATNIKVASVEGFEAGQKALIDTGANRETVVIATVGTAGATTIDTVTNAGASLIPVASVIGFRDGQTIAIDGGANSETAIVASVRRFDGTAIVVRAPLTHAHAAGAQVSGTGITVTAALMRAHASGTQVADNFPTPGAPNRFSGKHP